MSVFPILLVSICAISRRRRRFNENLQTGWRRQRSKGPENKNASSQRKHMCWHLQQAENSMCYKFGS